MSWKAHFFLNQSKKQDNIKTTYGFKSRLHPQQQQSDLDVFEKEFLDIVKLIKFRKVKDAFLSAIKKDIPKIKKSPNMFIFADKTNVIPAKHHEKLLKNYITKTYRKAPLKLANSINLEAKPIAKNLKLAD